MKFTNIIVAISMLSMIASACGSQNPSPENVNPNLEEPTASLQPFHIVTPENGQSIKSFPIEFEISDLPAAATHYHIVVSKVDSNCSVPFAIDGGFGRTISQIAILGADDFEVGENIYICVSSYKDDEFLSYAENSGIGVTVVEKNN